MLKIAQLSDLHLLADPTEERWGLNPQASFDGVLALALQHSPDALLLTGDLVHDESDEGYQRLKDRVQACSLPALAIPGNHDDPAKIAPLFGDPKLQLNGVTVIGLNSHVHGSDSGFLGDQELNRAAQLIENSEQPVLLAIHHPPEEVGSAWIDELGLADAEQLQQLIATYAEKILAITCGHVHQAFESSISGVPVLCSPSTNRQFLPKADAFATEDIAAGFRLHEITAGKHSSQVIRLA